MQTFLTTWRWLTRPAPNLNATERLQSSLLAQLLIILVVVGGLGDIIYIAIYPVNLNIFRLIEIIAIVCLAVVYGLNRTGRLMPAAVLTIGIISITIFSIGVENFRRNGDVTILPFLVIPLLFASVFLPGRLNALLIVTFAGGMLALTLLNPTIFNKVLGGPFSFFVLVAILNFALSQHRDQIEQQRQAALVEAELRYRTLVEQSPAVTYEVALSDAVVGEKHTVFISPQIKTLLGFTPAEWIADTGLWLRQIHPDDYARVLAEVTEKEKNHLDLNIEYRMLTRNGQTVWLHSHSIDIPSQIGIRHGLMRDITERKQAEDELKRSNAELEQFAYMASHDLQEPLRAVAGMVQLLGQRYKGKLDERADEYIGHAVEASTRMQNLINDLLDYSRVSRFGKMFDETDLENCLKNALGNLQLSIQESNTQLTHDPLPTLRLDGAQMTQVLQNLIGNAIKFRGARPLRIHIGAKKLEQAWQFNISDNGIGIEPQYFERIFLIFQRLHTRREYPGTGIGLSLCKKIIEQHGGQIWVESQPEQGSTFYFTIPEGAS